MKLKDYDFDDIDDIDELEDIDDLDDIDLEAIEDEAAGKKSTTKDSKIVEEKEKVKPVKKEEKIAKSTKKIEIEEDVEEDDDIDDDSDEEVEEKEPGNGKIIGKVIILIVVAFLAIFLLIKGCSKGNEYTVKFDTDGGSTISTQKIKKNDKVAVPIDPKKDGYEFIGWYIGDDKYDFDSKVTSNLTIKAKWEEVAKAKVSGIVLDQTTLKMLPNDTIKLVATVQPDNAGNKEVTWSTSNPAIATVDTEGNINALKEGTVIITATSQEGGFTAACTVVISNDVVKVTGIELDKKSVELGTNSTATIVATVVPANATNKGVLWTSSDESVVTVVNGKLTSKKAGTATITATTKDGEFKKTATVTVKDISVTGVSIKNAKELTIGNKLTLQAVITPTNATNKNVVWESSNTGVATIDANGNVVAKGEGTTTITVTTKDGNKKATVNIKVNKPIEVTGVTINNSSLSLVEGNSATLTANVLPSNAANKTISWTTSNPNVATVSNGKVTAKAPGNATITVTTTDGGHTATCEVTVTEKPATYVMILEGIKQEGTSAIAQYSVTITRNGSTFTGYTGYTYNGKKSKSNTLAVGDVDTSVTNATITVNGQSFPATVTYR